MPAKLSPSSSSIQFFFPYTLIKFDIEKEEPVRNSEGLCIEVAQGEPRPAGRSCTRCRIAAELEWFFSGETGLLVGRITNRSPFIGYAGNKQQTEKKRLRDVLRKGDLYFNTGDLLRFDHQNFIYFQDRVGDTFRQAGAQLGKKKTRLIALLPLVNS